MAGDAADDVFDARSRQSDEMEAARDVMLRSCELMPCKPDFRQTDSGYVCKGCGREFDV